MGPGDEMAEAMPIEIWVYGLTMAAAGFLVWRFAMQYHTFLEDTCKQSQAARDQLKRYLGVVEPPPAPPEEPAQAKETPADS